MRLFALFLFLGSLCPVVLADIIVVIEAERPPRFPEFSNDGEDPHRNCLQPDRHCQSTPVTPDDGDYDEDPGCQPGEPGCCLTSAVVIHKGRSTAVETGTGETVDWFSGMSFLRPLVTTHYRTEVDGLDPSYNRIKGNVELRNVGNPSGWRRGEAMFNGKLHHQQPYTGEGYTVYQYRTVVKISCDLHQEEVIVGGGVSVSLKPQVYSVVLEPDPNQTPGRGTFRDRFAKPCGTSILTITRQIDATETNSVQSSDTDQITLAVTDGLYTGGVSSHRTDSSGIELSKRTSINQGRTYTFPKDEDFDLHWYQYEEYYKVKAYYLDWKVQERYKGLVGVATIYRLKNKKENVTPCD